MITSRGAGVVKLSELEPSNIERFDTLFVQAQGDVVGYVTPQSVVEGDTSRDLILLSEVDKLSAAREQFGTDQLTSVRGNELIHLYSTDWSTWSRVETYLGAMAICRWSDINDGEGPLAQVSVFDKRTDGAEYHSFVDNCIAKAGEPTEFNITKPEGLDDDDLDDDDDDDD